jgi:hypothetical protein
MGNKEKLIKHIQFLCDELNTAGIKDGFGDQEFDWSVDESSPDMTFLGGFCHHPESLLFLKENDLLNMRICPFCGSEIITNRFKFTDTRNRNISFFICDSCHSKGKKESIVHSERDSSCYIATACYGSIHSPEVVKFREYRDDVLLKSFFGRQLVSIYYFISPCVARWMGNRISINNWVRTNILDVIYRKLQ